MTERTRRIVRDLGIAALAVIPLAACTASAPQDDDGGGGGDPTLSVTFTTSPATLDPAAACTLDDQQLSSSLYVQLAQFGVAEAENGTTQIDPTVVEPYFAHGWDISEDGTEYTFHLNDGWTFPSGEPMDAEAVKYSLERTLAMGGCGASIVNDLYLDPPLIQEVEAVDDVTVRITLAHSDDGFLSAMATPSSSIVDPSLIEENGGVVENETNDWLASNDAGSGPFRLESYTPGTSAVLVADEDFAGDPPGSARIEVSWVSSESTALLQAQNGESDITFGLANSSIQSLTGSDEVTVSAYEGTQSMVMTMPNDKEPWTDETLREAVVHAIPYQEILDNVLYGNGTLYYGPIPPSMPGYSEEHGQPIEYDLDRARSLAAEADVDEPVTVQLDILSGNDTQRSIATIVQSSLSEIGIDVSVNPLDSSAWSDAVYNGNSQAALRLDGPAIFNAGYYLQYDEHCDSDFNTGHICVPDNGALLDEARGATDTGVRDAAFAELTENWVAAYPRVTLYLERTPVAVGADVSSFYYSPMIDMRSWAK